MRISDWSSDVCSSDLQQDAEALPQRDPLAIEDACQRHDEDRRGGIDEPDVGGRGGVGGDVDEGAADAHAERAEHQDIAPFPQDVVAMAPQCSRSEEHTSELQSLMRTSYAASRLKRTKTPVHYLDTENTGCTRKYESKL